MILERAGLKGPPDLFEKEKAMKNSMMKSVLAVVLCGGAYGLQSAVAEHGVG